MSDQALVQAWVRYVADGMERLCYTLARYCFMAAERFESYAFLFAETQLKVMHEVRVFVEGNPTLQQWINRLIEFVDVQYIDVACEYFMKLLQDGMEPGEAFTTITEQRPVA